MIFLLAMFLLLASPARAAIPPEIEVTNVEYKITEKNSVWWRFSWKINVWNRGADGARFNAVVNFLEQQDFIVDRDYSPPFFIAAGNSDTFSGSRLINISIAPKVARARAEVRPIR
jgi:hypothetical protein